MLRAGLLIVGALAALGCARAQSTVTGVFAYPNGSVVAGGFITVDLPVPAARNNCSPNAQVKGTAQIKITAGALGTLHLFPTSCFTPSRPYLVNVYATINGAPVWLYRANWRVPDSPSSVDIAALDISEQ